ncbi:prevent-host-death family protein [Agrobacterium cavarae]|uniref:prevent-host-death family protein n=1 Tax=Agrobacterium cavarae TaxID=2528239 RepID=UPI0028AB2138|nr:prevent-host-death family protein [Agrobacterium cavarae]
MRILVDVTEAAEWLEELIDLACRDDEIVICRDERAVAMLKPIAEKTDPFEKFLSLAEEGRKAVLPGTTSDHSDFYEQHGLPK